MILGVLLVLLTGLSWVYWGIIMGRAPKEDIRVAPLLFYTATFIAVISAGVGLCQGVPALNQACLWMILSLVAGGFCNGFQLYLISLAMQKGPNGMVWLIAQAGFIVPFLTGVLFFDARCSLIRWGGFLAVLMTLVFIGLKKDKGKEAEKYGNWKVLAFGAFLATGALQVFSNLPSYFTSVSLSSVWRSAATELGIAISLFLLMVQQKNPGAALKRYWRHSRMWKYVFSILGMQLLVGFFCLYPGMDLLARHNAGAIAYPLMMAACLVGFEVYCYLFLRERRTWSQWIWLTVCLLGIFALSL